MAGKKSRERSIPMEYYFYRNDTFRLSLRAKILSHDSTEICRAILHAQTPSPPLETFSRSPLDDEGTRRGRRRLEPLPSSPFLSRALALFPRRWKIRRVSKARHIKRSK